MNGNETPNPNPNPNTNGDPPVPGSKKRKKRSLFGTPGQAPKTPLVSLAPSSDSPLGNPNSVRDSDPEAEAEVIALSPRTLLSSPTYACEICAREFRRAQNLAIHRRGHSRSAWSFPEKPPSSSSSGEKRRVYVCPEEGCARHDPAQALGDLTGIKKHYGRKHGTERRWACGTCPRTYAVRADWRAHVRACGGRAHECRACGTLFSRKDSYLIHRASCGASTAAEDDDDGVGFGGTTFNNNLLFPSLWGQPQPPTEAEGDEDELRAKGGAH